MKRFRAMKGWLGMVMCLALIVSMLIPPFSATPVLAAGESITLSPASGPAGTCVTVTGSGFAASTAGTIWFDTNGDGLKSNGESTVYGGTVTTDASGNIPAGTVLPVLPDIVTGTYAVQADFPAGDAIEASASFTVTAGILLTCNSGIPGVTTFVTGSGFAASTAGTVWFDTNGNGALDAGEPSMAVTTDAAGAIPLLTRLTVPSTGTGAYTVQADIPDGGSIEASATFTVTSSGIILIPAYADKSTTKMYITGSGFTPSTGFYVCFDYNGNGVRDISDKYSSGTTNSTGGVSNTTFIQLVQKPGGLYNVFFDLNKDGTVETKSGFVNIPIIKIGTAFGPARGLPGATPTINLYSFASLSSGYVWFDTNLNGVWDAGENKATVTTDATGYVATTGLLVPDVTPGLYQVCADIPACGLKADPVGYYVLGLILNPSSGTAGTSINITGYGSTSRSGSVWFDTNGNGALDGGEPSVAVTTDANGVMSPASLTAPDVAAGNYNVRTTGITTSPPSMFATFTLLGPPTAAFTATPTSGVAPLTVNFTDQSTGSPTSWAWDFDNDGTVDSADQNPTHVYTAPGIYTVNLTATNAYGSNCTVKTNYITVSPTITASAGEHGSISPSGDVVVNYGANQTFAISAGTGYHIADVLVDGGSAGAVTSYEFTNVTANHTISASFAIDTFTITASAGANGSIDPTGDVTVDYGANRSFSITAGTGYHITDVLVDSVSVGAVTSYEFTNVTANHTISASFAIDTFTITASAGANGSIDPTGDVTVDYGASQTFSISAGTGYHIADVLVDGVSVGAVSSYEFTNVTANHNITATFAINTYTISASAGANGSIDPTGDVTVDYGANQTFNITPAAGYHIANVSVDGSSAGAVPSYTFTNVTANHTISASFAPDWDLNGDHVCNIGDVVVIGLYWGQTGDPGWIPADLNKDGVINIGDVVVIGLYWGQTW